MIARTSWSAKFNPRSGESSPADVAGNNALQLDDLLDARFDEDGRLSPTRRANRQRIAERLDTRPSMSADDLERAVQKLAQGLEAIERQSANQLADATFGQPRPDGADSADRGDKDFVTYSLDRLEARLEALSRKIQQRSGGGAAEPANKPAPAPSTVDSTASLRPDGMGDVFRPDGFVEAPTDHWQPDPSLATDFPDSGDTGFRETVAERAGWSQDDGFATGAGEPVPSDAWERSGRGAPQRDADQAEELRRFAAEALERHAEISERRVTDAADGLRQEFAGLEGRIDKLQRNFDQNQIEPVRHELLALLDQVKNLDRDGRSMAGVIEQISAKLDGVETKLNAGRNMTGNRISELQDRVSKLAERIVEMEAEAPGFDAVRENQTAILERFDRIEGLVNRGASSDELIGRVDALKRQLQTLASQRETARIEEHILGLADRLDSLPATISERPLLDRIETQLQAVAVEFAEARQHGESGRSEVKNRLSDLYAGLREVAETGRTPDLSGLDERLSVITSRLDDDRRFSRDFLARLDDRLAVLTEAVERQENEAAGAIMAGLAVKVDALGDAIEAQDAPGSRRDLEALNRKLDQLTRSVSEQAEYLSRPQLEPLQERLDGMQDQLEELASRARTSTDQLGPFALKLQEISDRLSGIGSSGETDALTARLAAIEDRLAGLAGKTSDPRAIYNQLENIVSRLELLKGRSIDPARLTDLFDRVDTAMRAAVDDERLDRIERKLEDTAVPFERFDRLEQRIAESARASRSDERFDRIEDKLDAGLGAGLADDRFARLEQRFEEISRAYVADDREVDGAGEFLTQDDLSDLRGDIVALRRELRSLPGLGEGEDSLGSILRTIATRLERMPDDPPATALDLDRQIARVAQLLEDPAQSRLALAHIETSLKTIEERLEEVRRANAYRPVRDEDEGVDRDIETVAGLARALTEDVGVLRSASQVTEKKTRDALEAVQGTLEAVVKRMAFLERDADKSLSPGDQRRPDEHRAAAEMASRFSPDRGEHPGAPSDRPVAEAELPRESASGLFSRLSSSQLLKRATGGRADSFSPDIDDTYDAVDLPLEPGTDAPLNSALTGAPSSDTAVMSGTRNRGRMVGSVRPDRAESGPAARLSGEPAVNETFLSAARRAAQAASVDAADAERDGEQSRLGGVGRLFGRSRSRRQAVLVGALAVAVAFAAMQLLRSMEEPASPQVADLTTGWTGQPKPDSAPLVPTAPAADAIAAAPAAGSAAMDGSATVPAEQPMSAPSPAVDAEAAATAGPPPLAEATTAFVPDTPAMEPAPAVSTAPGNTDGAAAAEAALADEAGLDSFAAADPAADAELQGQPMPAGFPVAIGPDKLRDAALAGDPSAAFEIAARYAEGRGVASDLPAAVAWYTRAAEIGLAPAQYRLGSIYEKGLGVDKNLTVAQDWYRRAADAGNVKAMHNLAVLYAEGAGGKPDLERAAGLFRKAAEHGVRDSQFNLAILHARGLGVKQDMLEAFKWFSVAASSGDAEALKRKDIIAAALSEGDRGRAESAATAFKPLPLVAAANDVAVPEAGWGIEESGVQLQSDNDLVALVQKLLATKGYDPGPPDGLLGRQTIDAITRFQGEAGLPATGQVDTGLVAALQEQAT